MSSRWLLSVGLLGCVACGSDVDIRIELNTRTSCYPSTSYTIDCVDSLVVRMVDEERAYRKTCTPISDAYETLHDLIASGEPLAVLEDVRARSGVRLQMWAYHSLDSTDPCTSLEESKLMFWGSSDAVSFVGTSKTTVNVMLECRPECDCRAISEEPADCPADLVRGVCAPPKLLKCRDRECETHDDCFDGRLSCTEPLCEAAEKGMCSDCSVSSYCDSEICVHHTYSHDGFQIDEKFCAEPCPPTDGSAIPCPSGMKCTRLGDGVFEQI